MCQTQHIRLPHIEEEEEFDISNKTSPVEDDKVENLPQDIKNSVIKLKQIRTIFNPTTLTTKTTAYPSSQQQQQQRSRPQHPGFTSSIKLNRLLKRGILRGSSNNNNQSSSSQDTTSILQTTAAQIQKAQQQTTESNNTKSAGAASTHVTGTTASPAKMQAEQGSIGELQKYHSRYLKNRRHTLANVR